MRSQSIGLEYNHQHKDTQGCSVEVVLIKAQVSPLSYRVLFVT